MIKEEKENEREEEHGGEVVFFRVESRGSID